MKKLFVSAVAMLACAGCLALVVAFAYAKYRSVNAQNAAAGAALQYPGAATELLTGQASDARLGAHMPAQIGHGAASEPALDPVHRLLPSPDSPRVTGDALRVPQPTPPPDSVGR